ncbi:NADH-quinone oxidoreductase subunit I, partial [Francisella tularensis subsp. holarctica]|nr:NADH-quinone oxidoreductase subunit I [Francisella tularensis subsp. holarctica]
MRNITNFLKNFLLWELLKGLKVTGKHFYTRNVTLNYPDEKTPISNRFRGLHAI